jgi:enterobacteria phage integrase
MRDLLATPESNFCGPQRDLTDLEWKGSEPPSLHEMRSLAARLYDQQGVDSQVLLGHKDPATTALYRDNRGAEWMEVKV